MPASFEHSFWAYGHICQRVNLFRAVLLAHWLATHDAWHRRLFFRNDILLTELRKAQAKMVQTASLFVLGFVVWIIS